MRAVVQRVTRASVTIEGEIVGEIGNGLVVLLGIARDDTKDDADYLVAEDRRTADLRRCGRSHERVSQRHRWRAVGGFSVHAVWRRATRSATFVERRCRA